MENEEFKGHFDARHADMKEDFQELMSIKGHQKFGKCKVCPLALELKEFVHPLTSQYLNLYRFINCNA